MKNQYLALDFDGVIANSIQECLVVGYNAFMKFQNNDNRVYHFNELDSNQIKEATRIRNFIRSGEDYVYIYLILYRQKKIQSQEDFDHFTEKNKDLRPTFFEIFYSERQSFMEEHKELWLSLNPLYPEVKPFLKTYPNKERLYIITTKKTTFVNEILKANKIELSFDHLFHAKGKTKSEIIFDLLKTNNISKTDFFFIDDQVDTLVKTLETGVHCLLAEWGYNNEIQREKAKKNNIRILSLAQFTSQFKPG